MTQRSSVHRLLAPVQAWLSGRRDAYDANLEYWQIRHELMDGGEVFDGPAGTILSNIDTAMDSFNPDVGRDPNEIDEMQLRSEVEAAVARLRDIGVL